MKKGTCFVFMGVSGSGKTTLAQRWAANQSLLFLEGDDFHSNQNIAKMKSGQALTDADRMDWLEALHQRIKQLIEMGADCVITCSALKKSYRDVLRRDMGRLCFIFLHGTRQQILQRLHARAHHFMPPQLLESQFNTLEVPDATESDIISIDVSGSVEANYQSVKQALDPLLGKGA